MLNKIKLHETEKSHLLSKDGYITFLTGKNINKKILKDYVQNKYDTQVTRITSLTVRGKKKIKNRRLVILPDKKKFYVKCNRQIILSDTEK